MALSPLKLEKAIAELNDIFGVSILYSPFHDKCKWHYAPDTHPSRGHQGTISWNDEDEPLDEDGTLTYEEEVIEPPILHDGWTAFQVRDSFGEVSWMIFRNKFRLPE